MKLCKILLVATIAAASVAGCDLMPTKATEHGSVTKTVMKQDGAKETVENLSDYAAYSKAKLELASKPIFELTCPTTGCVLASLKVSAPGAGSDIAAPAPPPKVEHASVGIFRELKETVLGLQPVAMAHVLGGTVSKVFDSFGRSNESIAARIQAPQPNVTVNGSNTAVALGGNANSTGPVTTTTNTTTTTTSTSTANSNNRTSSQTCSGGSPNGTTSPGAGGSNNCTVTP